MDKRERTVKERDEVSEKRRKDGEAKLKSCREAGKQGRNGEIGRKRKKQTVRERGWQGVRRGEKRRWK